MRIISGKFKGRRIQIKGDITARPTTDFAKEGLFNLLNNRIDFEDIRVLDLFAGTGSISMEFISRGCDNTISIEQNDKHCVYIRKVMDILQIDNLNLIKTDVFKYIESCHNVFDVVFADPPYDLTKIPEIPDLIFKHNLLTEDGLFILEHSGKNDFSTHPYFVDHRHYGNVHFTFFSKSKD